MAAPRTRDVWTDEQGQIYSRCLHYDGFPSLLWEELQKLSYLEPPLYVGESHIVGEMSHCRVTVTVHSPTPQMRGNLSVTAHGNTFDDTCELAAWKALTHFCQRHQLEVQGTSLELFPTNVGGHSIPPLQVALVQNQNSGHYNPRLAALTKFTGYATRSMETVTAQMSLMSMNAQTSHAQNRAQIEQLVAQNEELMAQNEQLVMQAEENHDLVHHLQEQIHDLQLEVEADPALQAPPPPPELPEQGDTDIEEEPGTQAIPAYSDSESVNQPPPPRRAPCYGWISEESEEEEDPEERIFYMTP
jgi:hypothetical protein